MHLKTRNVNTAFHDLVTLFHYERIQEETTGYPEDIHVIAPSIIRRPSRNGEVLMIDEPVTITYERPTERVLLNPARDANPFALLYEALWMLAGRNDVAPLAYYTKQFTEYSDDGKTLNGSYGYRWRHHRPQEVYTGHTTGYSGPPDDGGTDQLDLLVAHLKADPASRRAVLQMWNVENDLLKVGPKHSEIAQGVGLDYSLDVCCNLSVMLSLRSDDTLQPMDRDGRRRRGVTLLDMTVTNRSNDLVWGLLGANYVTFSLLQEYLAARLGVEVGRYHHFTNNLHVYTGTNGGKTARWDPEAWLAADRTEYHEPSSGYTTVPLVADPVVFEKELPIFVDRNSGSRDTYSPVAWRESFLNDVTQPMMTAFRAHKEKWGGGAMMWAEQIKDDAWRVAATEWLQRRADRKKEKEHV